RTYSGSLRGNLHRDILRGHHLAFGIARHQANAIRARRDFEFGANWNRSILAIERDVFHKTKGNDIRNALDVAAIAVEQAADHLHVVAVLTVDFAVMQPGDVYARYDRQFRFGVADLRQLRRRADGDIVNLIPAEHRFVNFFLGVFARTRKV